MSETEDAAQLRERVAELEAVIDHVRRWNVGKEFLAKHPSVVLEDRDRENRAIGWDEGRAQAIEDVDTSGYGGITDSPNPYRGDNE